MRLKAHIYLVQLLYSFFLVSVAYAHGPGPSGIQPLDWHTEQISQVNAFMPLFKESEVKTEVIDGKNCMVGPLFGFDISDDFAYDIDETVIIDVEFETKLSPENVQLRYDGNGHVNKVKKAKINRVDGKRFKWHRFLLERARFSGRGVDGVVQLIKKGDFSIGSQGESFSGENITICNIVITRSYKTRQASEYGDISLAVVDENNQPVAVRVGIYDKTGRTPLPQKSAVPVKYFSDTTRSVSLPDNVSWPVNNRQAFYVNGNYHASLPSGLYNLVVSRGLEYRFLQKPIYIKANQNTFVEVKLTRWDNMSEKGWFSGEVHIHTGRRDVEESDNLRLQLQAEDLNVGNFLQMGNIGAAYYMQYDWGKEHFGHSSYYLAPGQEDPRTSRLGHTIQLNINKPIRFPERYYLYHKVFEETHRQGGLVGYAHGGRYRYGCSGFAIDLPYDTLDFVEILIAGRINSDCWFDALNLGYKISPAAGTDYPYGGIPGADRAYVKTEKLNSTQVWFDRLKAGRVFVTNGPMLQLRINGHDIGSELKVAKGAELIINAAVKINPDIDLIESLELIQHGEVIATNTSVNGVQALRLTHKLKANQGSWFVVRARGKNKAVAISAPIYVIAGNSGFCKPSVVPSTVARLKQVIEKAIDAKHVDVKDTESWHSLTPKERYWPENKEILKLRVRDSFRHYDHLVAMSANQRCVGG